MHKLFVDFWSINRWLCQFDYFVDELGQKYVADTIIVHPNSVAPYEKSQKFKYWTVDQLSEYLNILDGLTNSLTCLPQTSACGKELAAMSIIIFPCPNEQWYAGYPADNPKYYVTLAQSSFEVSEWQVFSQSQLSSAARRLHRAVTNG